jgi:hypothetical protein
MPLASLIRWACSAVLEDFLQYPQEPVATIEKRVEGWVVEFGKERFSGVFQASVERVICGCGRRTAPGSRIEGMDPNIVIALSAGVQAGATVVLVWVTIRYARSTAGMLAEMKRQRADSDRQARVQTVAAELTAEGILNYFSTPHGLKRVEQLAAELRKLQEQPALAPPAQ